MNEDPRDQPTQSWTPEFEPEDDYEAPSGTRRVSPADRARTRAASSPAVDRQQGARRAPDGPRRRLGLRRLVALAVLALIIGAIVFAVLLFQPFTGKGSGSVTVQIPRGASASQIGDILARDGVVDSSFFFSLRTKVSGQRSKLRSGAFRLKKGMSYASAIDALTRMPPAAPVSHFTIPEGLSRREVAARLAGSGLTGSYVNATKRAPGFKVSAFGAPAGTPTLEGFLFPATYDLKPHAPASALVAKQLTAFRRNFDSLSLAYAKRKQLTAYDLVVIASMVEREAQRDDERPLVAAVIYNRLHDHIPLGIDATLRYALNDWTKPLTQSQLALPTPYNTRLRQGLPPTPIGNPGLASLKAAANPAKSPFLYYVVKPGTCGRHAFSSTNAQFLADVARYNAARTKAGGRSPTTCKQ
jgi:uncharacterized YceG family protein